MSSNFICNLCNKEFTKFSNYKQHKNRKYPCVKEKNPIHNCEHCHKTLSSKASLQRHLDICKIKPISPFHCEFCDKYYTRKDTLKRHFEICKKKMNSISQPQSQTPQTIQQAIQQQTTNQTMNNNIQNGNTNNIHNGSGDNINNTNIHNGDNNIQNIQIIVNKFGNENTDYITEEQFRRCFEVPFYAIPRMIELIHYHPLHPENHNVRMTMTNKKYGLTNIWDGKSWNTKDKKMTLENLIDKGYYKLDDEFEYQKKELKTMTTKRFKNYRMVFENLDKKKNNKFKKDLYKNLEITMLNGTNKMGRLPKKKKEYKATD